jgi:hypothetical protein
MDGSRSIKVEPEDSVLRVLSEQVSMLEKKIEEYCSHLKSLEDDIEEVVDKDTVIDIINDMVNNPCKCWKRRRYP